MLNITLICVGGLKENYWREAAAEYEKRLSAFCKIKIIEIEEQRLPYNPSQAQIDSALKNEADRILSKIQPQSRMITLCIEGISISSQELSKELEQTALHGQSSIVFIIGSSFGLHEQIKSSSMKISMSQMTFPHQLARVMLLEQLYRAFQISSNGKYHK